MTTRLSAFAALNNSDSDSDSDSEGEGNVVDNVTFENTAITPLNNSNFSLREGVNVQYHHDYILLALQSDDILVIKGRYSISVIQGSVLIDGYTLVQGKSLKINASSINSLPSIQSNSSIPIENDSIFSSTNTYTSIIKLENIDNHFDEISNLYSHVKYLYNSEISNSLQNTSLSYTFTIIIEPELNKSSTLLHQQWLNIFQSIINESSMSINHQSILTIGNKNTGKSTFSKLLINTLLSISNKKIQLLDIDPGQPELCLPGCISLTQITSPLIGTILPWENNTATSILTKFIGFSSPNHQPLKYLKQLDHLIDNILSSSNNTITIINSPGWVKGFGTEIISHLKNKLSITYLIQLSHTNKDLDILQSIEWDYETKIFKALSFSSLSLNFNLYSPAVIRNFKLLSYMHYNHENKNYNFKPLLSNSPLKVSYITSKDYSLLINYPGILGFTIFDHPFSYTEGLHESLECQYVAIVTIPSTSLTTKFSSNILKHENCPNYINETILHSLSPHIKFHGLALIHSIDTKNNTINMYTPIDFTNIRDNLLNNNEKLFILKGREDTPIEEIYPVQILKDSASYWSSFGLDALPYVSASLSNEVMGGKISTIRRNIQRR